MMNEDKNFQTQNMWKNTKARKAVIEILKNSQEAISAEDIYLRIKQMGYSTNISTVYRNLEMMESMKLVIKTVMNDGVGRYQLKSDLHKHLLVCTNCHATVPINDCPLEKLEKEIKQETDFDITGHRLELYGICPKCKMTD